MRPVHSPLFRRKQSIRPAQNLVGVVNIPIIKFSVEWWNTLHQGSTIKINEKSSMVPEMLWPLLLSIAGFYLFFAFVFVWRLRAEILNSEYKTRWVQTLISEQ